jgi:hypothetical protein
MVVVITYDHPNNLGYFDVMFYVPVAFWNDRRFS